MFDIYEVPVEDVVSGVTSIVSRRRIIVVSPCRSELCFSAILCRGSRVVIDKQVVDVSLGFVEIIGRYVRRVRCVSTTE